MRKIILFTFLLFSAAEHCDCADGSTFTREQAWTCCMRVVDTNGDKRIDVAEIDAAKAEYLAWWQRAILGIFSNTANVLKDCDANGDNVIDAADFEAKKVTCMPYYDPYRPELKIDALCKAKEYLCDVAAEKLKKPTY